MTGEPQQLNGYYVVKPHHLETFRAAGAVKRYHIVRTLRQQSVAEHSWNVALLVYMIYPQASPKLIKAALTHDVAEITKKLDNLQID